MIFWVTTMVRQLSGQRMQTQAMTTHDLPLRRYFLFVGGGLLALLFLLNAVLPPPETKTSAVGPNLPVSRIHSELKRPPAVAIDTSQSITAPVIAVQDDNPATPAPLVAPDSRIRESFAQFVLLSKRQTSATEPKKPERSPLPKRKAVVVHVQHPAIHIAQHQTFSRPTGEPGAQQ
jgi:hypothetical protein